MILTAILASAGCGSTHLASNAPPAVDEARSSASGPTYDIQAPERRRYTPADWPQPLHAEVYLPETPGTTARPAALVVHGGGWQNRGPSDMRRVSERLAAEGFVVLNLEHRFAPAHPFPAQLHDLQRAMSWLHERADEWRIDTQRIVGVGYSSGAHLVSLLALAGHKPPLAEPHGGEHTRLAAVLAGGLPSDLFKFPDGRLVVEFLGGTRAEVPARYQLASPIQHVSSASPPFFLYHGRADRLVPVDHATDFYAALHEQGVAAELYLQHGRGHFASFLTQGPAIEAGIAFLRRQLALAPPDQGKSASLSPGASTPASHRP